MDFVARAGAIVDRAHRIAGMLLICVVILGTFATCQFVQNRGLNAQLNERRRAYPVIVVPGATTGVYAPTEEDRLIYLFAEFVTQSINTYTPENVARLYANLRQFMGPALLTDSQPYFDKKMRDIGADRRSSFFVPDRSQPLKIVRRSVNSQEFRDITLYGEVKNIVGGTVAEGVPLEITMTFLKGFSSPANPYGFTLTNYHESSLIDPNKTPRLPSAVQP